MDLINRIKDFFKAYSKVDEIKGPLPFVQTMGFEKSYGKPHPQDYTSLIDSYKSWVYACAWKNATSVAKCKLSLYRKTIDENGEETLEKYNDPEHPFNKLMATVNPFSNKFELFTITQTNVELTGNAYWWIPRDALGVPYMIWNIPAHWVRIIPDPDKFIAGYVVRVPPKGQMIPFDESEIVHFKFPSPFDLFYGTGPTWAAQYGVALNDQVKMWGINFFMNNAQPSGILTTDSSLNADQYSRLKDRWNAKYKGSRNAGKIAILEAGLKYQQTGSTVRDARVEMITAEVRDEIMAMFGVPSSKLGLSDHVNRANADANDYTYQKETIQPRLTLIEEKLNEKLISMYDPNLCVRFESPVPKDDAVRATERAANISCGYSSIDDERIADGLEPYDLPETSVPLIPFNLVPAGTPKPKTDAQGNPIQSGTDPGAKSFKAHEGKWHVFAHATAPQEKLLAGVMKRYFEAQHSEVSRKINNFKGFSKDLSATIMFNKHEADGHLKNISKPNVRTAVVTGLELGIVDTGKGINFNLFEPNIARAVEQRIGFFASKVNQTTLDLIQNAINDGLSAGEPISDIAKRLDAVYSFRENFSSKLTAQTEVIGATNSGQLMAYREAGVEQKRWLTALDEKVRDSHVVTEGQTVDLDQSFITGDGNYLQYPGDRSSGAAASDIINCRCTLSPVIKI